MLITSRYENDLLWDSIKRTLARPNFAGPTRLPLPVGDRMCGVSDPILSTAKHPNGDRIPFRIVQDAPSIVQFCSSRVLSLVASYILFLQYNLLLTDLFVEKFLMNTKIEQRSKRTRLSWSTAIIPLHYKPTTTSGLIRQRITNYHQSDRWMWFETLTFCLGWRMSNPQGHSPKYKWTWKGQKSFTLHHKCDTCFWCPVASGTGSCFKHSWSCRK